MSEPLTLKAVYTGASEQGPRLVGLLVDGERRILRWLPVEDGALFEVWRRSFFPGDAVSCTVILDEGHQVMTLVEMRRADL